MAKNYKEIVKEEWEKVSKGEHRVRPTIMLLGATGCGKSSLINLVFKENLAYVSDNSRGTNEWELYLGEKHNIGINLIDSRGYEMEDGNENSFSAYYEDIAKKIEESRNSDLYHKIHIIWYCISVAAKRVQDFDIEILKRLRQDSELKKRIAVVVTKCDQDDADENGNWIVAKEFKNIIAREIGSSMCVFEVSNDTELKDKLELEKLINWSADQLDDRELKEEFVSSQMVSLSAKEKSVNSEIKYFAGIASGIGATPIPMSDAPLLTTLQMAMSIRIIRIYGLANLAHITPTTISNVIIPNLGKSLAGGLIKLIPGAGTVVGALINGGVAFGITEAMGLAISKICLENCKKIVRGEDVDMAGIFDFENVQQYTQEYMATKD